jgi:hypothetical protein
MLPNKKQKLVHIPMATTLTTALPQLTAGCNVNVVCAKSHAANIELLSCVVSQLIEVEECNHPTRRGVQTRFHADKELSIGISDYMKRVVLHSKVSTEVAFQAVFHLNQLMRLSRSPLIINKLNIHRLLLTAIMTTAKYFDDTHYNNVHFAHVGGVPLSELNVLEVDFLEM